MICDEHNLSEVIQILDNLLSNKNCVVLLQGDLASGKTTLVRKFIEFKNITGHVTSPTFSLQKVYGENIYHYDVYNKNLDEFFALGMLEEFEKQGIHFVEWGDEKLEKILENYGFCILRIKIKKIENKREYLIEQINS